MMPAEKQPISQISNFGNFGHVHVSFTLGTF